MPRPESTLPAGTVDWLEGRPQHRFVLAVWARLAELEAAGCPTAPIDALRSVLLDHQPSTRSGRCRGCRRLNWRHRIPWSCRRRRHFPCIVWSQIGIELLEHPGEQGRHRLP